MFAINIGKNVIQITFNIALNLFICLYFLQRYNKKSNKHVKIIEETQKNYPENIYKIFQ